MKESKNITLKPICFDRNIKSRIEQSYSCFNPLLIPRQTTSLRLARKIERKLEITNLSKSRNSLSKDFFECNDNQRRQAATRLRKIVFHSLSQNRHSVDMNQENIKSNYNRDCNEPFKDYEEYNTFRKPTVTRKLNHLRCIEERTSGGIKESIKQSRCNSIESLKWGSIKVNKYLFIEPCNLFNSVDRGNQSQTNTTSQNITKKHKSIRIKLLQQQKEGISQQFKWKEVKLKNLKIHNRFKNLYETDHHYESDETQTKDSSEGDSEYLMLPRIEAGSVMNHFSK